jgi:hypothetical protein
MSGGVGFVTKNACTDYLWTGESRRCKCTHGVESHKTIHKEPFTAICYGDFTNSTRPCKCTEFIPYRNISEEVSP